MEEVERVKERPGVPLWEPVLVTEGLPVPVAPSMRKGEAEDVGEGEPEKLCVALLLTVPLSEPVALPEPVAGALAENVTVPLPLTL